MRPRFAVESLYYTTQWQVGIVVASEIRHIAIQYRRSQYLFHCLYAVERTALVVAYDVDALLVGCKQIGTRHHLLQSCLLCLLLAEVDCEAHTLLIGFEETKVVGKLLLLVDDVNAI